MEYDSSIEFPYSLDTGKFMRQLGDLSRPVFLDSCRQSGPMGRFDILSALPAAWIEVDKGQLICSEPLPDELENDFIAAIKHLMTVYQPQEPLVTDNDIPFTGGLLGHIGYPKLGIHGRITIDNAVIGIYLWSLTVDHELQRCVLKFNTDCPDSTRKEVTQALSQRTSILNKFKLLENFSRNSTNVDYTRAFSTIKNYIEAGDCYQVNLTQRISSSYQGDPLTAYLILREKAGKPYSAFLASEQKAVLSLSPERLLNVIDGKATTQPIKGTRPRGKTRLEDEQLAFELKTSEKDRAENLMIVDLLRNDFGTLCELGSIKASPLFELHSFSNVHHLISTVSGKLRKDDCPLDLFNNCFPGGSVTGAPKRRAMEIIEELEKDAREIYCGSVIYWDFGGRMDSNITIRTLLCEAGNIYCWAGGGIVADSQCHEENSECFDKIQQIINTLEGLC